MADTDTKVDKQLEHQREVVKEHSRDPAAQHPARCRTAHRARRDERPEASRRRRAPREIKLGGGPEKVAQQHERGKLTARERVDLPGSTRHVRRDRHARAPALLAALDGGPCGPCGVITLGRGRGWAPWRDRRLRLHRDGRLDGMTGEIKVAAGREMGASKPGCRWSGCCRSAGARPGGGRLAVRRLRPPFAEEVIMSGVIPLVPACSGPRAARPTSPVSGLRPDGLRPRRDGPCRALPREGRHR